MVVARKKIDLENKLSKTDIEMVHLSSKVKKSNDIS